MERIAIIDLGTNTFKILLADISKSGKYQTLMTSKVPVKLSEGGVLDNLITTDAFQRGINVLNMFRTNIIDYYKVDKVFAFATAGIRSASNGLWFVDYVRKHIGIDIKIISGAEEASLIYRGVATVVSFEQKPFLVCDIGGGSTEFIIGNKNGILWKHSFRLGASRMAERHSISNPILDEEVKAMEKYYANKLKPLFEALKKYPTNTLVGSSGAFSTLTRMTQYRQAGKPVKQTRYCSLQKKELLNTCDNMLITNDKERSKIPGMKLMRLKMIVPASVFIRFIMKKINFENILFSDFAMKEGIFAQVIDEVLTVQRKTANQ